MHHDVMVYFTRNGGPRALIGVPPRPNSRAPITKMKYHREEEGPPEKL